MANGQSDSEIGFGLMERENGQIHRDGCLYIPFHSAPLAAGPFLPTSADSICQHLVLPPEYEFRHGIWDQDVNGVSTPRPGLHAARIHGNSMIERNILHGDVVVLQQWEFDYIENGKIVAIERLGDEEGTGAWSLKLIRIELPGTDLRDLGGEIGSENPVIILRSYNRRISPWQLNPSGQYRIRGVFRRSIRAGDVRLVDSEMLREIVNDPERKPSNS
jgi:hypothetical protein